MTGSQASTEFELIAGADPYFSNLDPSQDNQPYLSQDLRVFSAAPAINSVPFPGVHRLSAPTALTERTTTLRHCSATSMATAASLTPTGTDPFSLLPDQQGEGQTDSSVAPFAFDFNNSPLPDIANNYNFAIARVRLRGTSGASGAADKVRVFFRVFGTQSNDTDFDPNGTYFPRPTRPVIPARPARCWRHHHPVLRHRQRGQRDRLPGGRTEHPDSDNPQWAGQSVVVLRLLPQLLRSRPTRSPDSRSRPTCPARIIAWWRRLPIDGAPIPTGVSPMSWDQLAQRNLQFTAVDNPGPASTHRAPQTFDCRPSGQIGQPGGARAAARRVDDRVGQCTKGSDRLALLAGGVWQPR